MKMGIEVYDDVTHFQGIAVARIEYISGCVQWLVQPPVGEDKKRPESEWFDEQRLVEIEGGRAVALNNNASGFDRPGPKDYRG
jgi:hypothetical protein